jgi:hypothetical protein
MPRISCTCASREARRPCCFVLHGTNQKTHDGIENNQVRLDGFDFAAVEAKGNIIWSCRMESRLSAYCMARAIWTLFSMPIIEAAFQRRCSLDPRIIA